MLAKIKRSEQYAQKVFEGHIRLCGETLYRHATNVRRRLIDIGIKDENLLIAAILHDINKFKEKRILEEIKKEFGNDVYNILVLYKKFHDTDIKIDSPSKNNSEYIIQAYINMAENPNVLLLLLADKTENSKTLYALSKSSRISAAKKALYLYAPICRLVGLYFYALELEKNSFMILYPSEYFKITKVLKEKSIITKNVLENLRELIYEYLEKNNVASTIKYRIKSEYSIFRKVVKYRKDKRQRIKYEELYDVAAIRIVVDTVEECYMVEDLLKKIWPAHEEERDDYITNPKPSNYQSLHNIFTIEERFDVEIQIRTREMHRESEFGNASHLFYKFGERFKKYLSKNPEWIKSLWLIDSDKKIALSHFSDFVYVFTPKGDIIELVRGSSALDFAYAIHEEIGNRCIGVLVNKQIKKLSYELNDGDKVEVKISSAKNNANRDWLDYVKTKYAKKCIRKVIRNKKRL